MIVIDPPPAGDDEPAGYEALLAAGMRQFGPVEAVDPEAVAIEAQPRRRRRMGWAVLASCVLSVKFHAAAVAGMFAWRLLGFVPPSIELQSRKASIALIASIEAAPDAKEEVTKPLRSVTMPKPKPPNAKPKEPKPEVKREAVEIVKAVTAREPTKRREPTPDEIAMTEPEPPTPEAPKPVKQRPDEEPQETPDEPQARPKRPAPKVAPIESAASMASLEVEGSQFDEFPQGFYNPKPPYPADAYAHRQEGVVWLQLHISATGVVEHALIVQSSGVPSLDDAAVRTALTWRYRPARLLGRDVRAILNTPVNFHFPRN